ncbi:uncharacterized protein LY89DRAFT_89740 [Mollisia scopiformis]|uniref:Pentatricopeptide repeat-containing protein n=1 Tax=Mollisia scopiformis TaxID=149040 RepID=A0A194X616_MOLSC|nr:uncharacterized protein LY89DRAFT_89740 [Mollisia scopiformis]KUJ15625.1 hypothetical protein LY89DRAFT_89740 [Mollisia scopiformis]
MPPPLGTLKKRWSTFELPILPFLAPRVFKPWPCDTRRIYHQGQAIEKRPKIVRDVAHLRSKHRNYGHQSREQVIDFRQADGILGAYGSAQEQMMYQGGIRHDEQAKKSKGVSTPRRKLEETENEEFLRLFSETWHTPLAPEVRKPPEDMGPKLARRTRGSSHVVLGFRRLAFGPLKAAARDVPREQKKRRKALRRRMLKLRVDAEVERLRIPQTRPRYISLQLRGRYRFPWSYGEWNQRFTILNLRHEKFMRSIKIPREVKFHARRPTVKLPTAIEQALSQDTPTVSFRLIWENLERRTRSVIWPEVMLRAMENRPQSALNIVEATFMNPFPPAFAVADCLQFIISDKYSHPLSDDFKDHSRFVNRVRTLLYLGAQKRVYLPQHSIHSLMSHLKAAEVMRFYITLKQVNHPLHENTLLQFASKLSKSGSAGVLASLNILEGMKDAGWPLNTPKALSVFSTMLKRFDRDSDARQLDSRILDFMMSSGVSPNIITYNILLHNSIRDGEFETGWNIYDMMMENDVEPDAYTYSSLLNDAKNRMDSEAIKKVIGIVKDKGIRNGHIITDVLHAIFLLHRDRTTRIPQFSERHETVVKPAFESMLQVYCEYFDTRQLRSLLPSFTSRYSDVVQCLTSSQQRPSVPTLVVMITAYLAGLGNPVGVRQFYLHFVKLLESRDSVAIEVAKTTHIWSVIIMNLSRFSDGLSDCPEVVGTMLSNTKLPPHFNAGHEDNDASLLDPLQPGFNARLANSSTRLKPRSAASRRGSTLPKMPQLSQEGSSHGSSAIPNVFIWSILLKIFMDYQQPRAAEKVLEMMKERGVEPNMITWNTLVVGYSKMQAILDTVDVLRRMEDAGFSPDDVTMRALSKLNDKRTTIAALEMNERLRAQRGKQEKEDLAQYAEENEEGEFDSDDLIKQWDEVGSQYRPKQG